MADQKVFTLRYDESLEGELIQMMKTLNEGTKNKAIVRVLSTYRKDQRTLVDTRQELANMRAENMRLKAAVKRLLSLESELREQKQELQSLL